MFVVSFKMDEGHGVPAEADCATMRLARIDSSGAKASEWYSWDKTKDPTDFQLSTRVRLYSIHVLIL